MKKIVLIFTFFVFQHVQAQISDNQNIIIITTDGFRWQELFMGADPAILHQPEYVTDTVLCSQLFGGTTPHERRLKLLPFFGL